MSLIKSIFFIFFLIIFFSCKTELKYKYAIRDFRSSLQPYLISIVSKGFVGYDTSTRFLEVHATIEDLRHLSLSENPILRVAAFRALLERPGTDHFGLLMNHLDDTAIVAIDEGEHGIIYSTVSDDIIQHSKWKNLAEKKKTIDKVITEHNYLQSAYTILTRLKPEDKYYAYIKKMAQGDRNFEDRECALYGLARYKKPGDIAIIKEALFTHSWRMGYTSFRLMKEYPDEAYLDVLEKYSQRILYRKICLYGTGNDAEDFFNAIASYKQKRSAGILNSILNRKPFMPCPADTDNLRETLLYAIWNNKCDAYSKIINQVKPFILASKKNRMELPLDSSDIINVPEFIRW